MSQNPASLFLETLEQSGFSGDIETDLSTRLINATDNSAYQIMPLAVLAPKNTADVQRICQLLHQPQFKRVSISPRGGGTGTNGQSLTEGMVVDCSKHMTEIIELDLKQGFVTVQSGVVLDQLNAHLKPHGVMFGPTLSTSNRATIGGMVNTDACGKGSLLYGKTSQNVIAITAVYSDGSIHTSASSSPQQLKQLQEQANIPGKAYQQVNDTVCRCQKIIEEQYPKLTRFMTGYDLKHVYNDTRNHFNLNAVLCGSEGTLAIVTEVTLKLTPIPKYHSLTVLQYKDFHLALSHAQLLLSTKPGAIETIDGTILNIAKTDIIYDEVKHFIETPHQTTNAVNFIEFVSDDEAQLKQQQNRLLSLLKTHDNPAFNAMQATNDQDIAALWTLRKKSVGLLAKSSDAKQPVSGVEDTVVAPEKLADYMRAFCKILDGHGLRYGIFGHVDTGCLHVRPAYDLKDPNDANIYFKVIEQVAQLVNEYGGLIWGEHGKGMRSQYVPMFFGNELYDELRKIKKAFDPLNQLNPGKIATPIDSDAIVVPLQSTLRAEFDRDIRPTDFAQFNKSLSCNGNGACFNYDYNNAMCPSYKVTRDRCYSPKGRATLIREWLRQKATGLDEEYLDQVFDSMNHCLGCKACATGCPVNINIPNEKSKFLHEYHQYNSHTLADHMIIQSEQIAHKQSQWPKLSRFLQQLPFSNHISKNLFNLVDLPLTSEPNLKQLCSMDAITLNSLDDLSELTPDNQHVVILQDTLTSCYDAPLVVGCVNLLKSLGFKPLLFDWFINGKALHVKGLRDDFKHLATTNAKTLSAIAQRKLPMIGIEPSITLTYSDEYTDILDSVDFEVSLLQNWLVQQTCEFPTLHSDKPLLLLLHCTESTQALQNTHAWQQLFKKFGLDIEIANVGCCGMAGSYGHEAHHAEQSKQLFEMSWQQHMNDDHIILATGFSCRSQIKRFSQHRAIHPMSFLIQQLSSAAS